MNFLMRHRNYFRIFLIVIILITIVILNIFLYRDEITYRGILLTIALPVLSILNEYLPDISSYIYSKFGPDPNEEFISGCIEKYRLFLEDFFSIDITIIDYEYRNQTIFSVIDRLTDEIPDQPFGNNKTSDKRRRPIVALLFLIKYDEILNIYKHVNLSSYIRQTYRDLTDSGKKEIISAFNNIVIQEKHYTELDEYFDYQDEESYQRSKLRFFDKHMKDDFITEITSLLNFKEAQVRSFKESIRSIAESEEFNLDYLHDFVKKRREYRKLYLIAAEKRFPKRIQKWITQQTHFILSYSSIANIPRVGLSDRYDIFFFSPTELIPSAQDLFDLFINIDPSVKFHPVRIFEIDTSEGLRSSLDKSSTFSESISYFEARSFDGTRVEDLSYSQLLSILDGRNVSLINVISDLPPSEYSNTVLTNEKEYVNHVLDGFISNNSDGVFGLLSLSIKEFRDYLFVVDDYPILYTDSQVEDLFGGNSSKSKIRERIVDVFKEIKINLKLIQSFLD